MVGPPGTGKTLLARALPGVLSRLPIEEALVVTWPNPGEISKPAGLMLAAHRGVLFLDELPGFGPRVLEALELPRTIADLAGRKAIETLHLAEALQYRPSLVG